MDARTSQFPVVDAKARFSELIARAEAGDEITITRHGTPVARIVPVGDAEAQAVEGRRRAREEYLEWLRTKGPTLGPDLTIRQLINEGRR